MPHAASAPVLLCTGKDCRDAKGYGKLRAAVRDVPGALGVPCQGVCEGPVVGVRVKGDVRWFAAVRGAALRDHVLAATAGGEVAGELREHEVRDRRGAIDHPKKAEPLRR